MSRTFPLRVTILLHFFFTFFGCTLSKAIRTFEAKFWHLAEVRLLEYFNWLYSEFTIQTAALWCLTPPSKSNTLQLMKTVTEYNLLIPVLGHYFLWNKKSYILWRVQYSLTAVNMTQVLSTSLSIAQVINLLQGCLHSCVRPPVKQGIFYPFFIFVLSCFVNSHTANSRIHYITIIKYVHMCDKKAQFI